MAELQNSVSCANLSWLFELCDSRNINVDTATKGVPYPLEHLRDETRFITWNSFTDVVSNVAKYFDDYDLRETGKNSWLSGPLMAHGSIGRIMFTVKDQYLATYGTLGYTTRNYPFESSIEQPATTRLVITLSMKDGMRTCHPLNTIIAGQMEALPTVLGLGHASVTMRPLANGTRYTVEFPEYSRLTSLIRRLTRWFTASKLITREFALLLDSYTELGKANQFANERLLEAEERLRSFQSSYELVGSNINDLIFTLDENLQVGNVSPSVTRTLGYPDSEFISLPLTTFFDDSDFLHVQTLATTLLNAENDSARRSIEVKMLDKNANPIWFELAAHLNTTERGRNEVVCIATDITQRKDMEGELTQRTTNYQIITDSALDAIITFDRNNRITYANPACSDVFGYSAHELIGMDAKAIMPESLGDSRLRELYRAGASVSATGVPLRGLRKDKSLVPLEVSIAGHELTGEVFKTCIVRDVTSRMEVEQERQALETQLQASQKMDSIGQLSGGIAHDFNNLLVAILGYADLALQARSEGNLSSYIEEIKKAGERGTDMTQKLLTFSRRQVIEPKLVEINDLIGGVKDMITRLLPQNIEVRFMSRATGKYIMADPTQMEQVLINLAVNARDAMPGGGTLSIEVTSTVEEGSGQQLLINVSDTGTGMDEEVQKRIFEPFYTTKPEGSGTGLGLAVVFGIVNQHDGFVRVSSQLGEGTTFSLYFPEAEADSDSATGSGERKALGGTETILLVEDNAQVRDLARLILVGAGYNVIEAGDGQEAVEQFESLSDSIDLVLMDIVMPRMGGKDAALSMRRHKPDVNIVFTSGYSDNSVHTQFIRESNLPLIPKPYGTDLLRAQIRSVLDGDLGQLEASKIA